MPKSLNSELEVAEDPDRLKKLLRGEQARYWAKKREETLLDLANLPDDSCQQFRRRFRLMYQLAEAEDDSRLLRYRDQLRRIWSGSDPDGDALHFWVRQATLNNRQSWLVATGRFSMVMPNYRILPLSLAIGVTDLAPKMAVCENPDCPQRYFLKGRKSQRFCDRPACAAYGQRAHKRKWWEEKGKKRRAQSKLSKKRLKKRGKKGDSK